MRNKFLAVILLTSLVGAAPQDRWYQQVDDQLIAIIDDLSGYANYELTHEIIYGSLGDSRSRTTAVRLNAGVTYVIAGVCDADCSDLDLRVFDYRWNELAADTGWDDEPAVVIVPRYTATYRIRATMADCSINPCRYGVGVFGPA